MDIEIGTMERGGGQDSSALAVISHAEIDVQIATARRFPRSIVAFKRTAEELACLDEDTAGSMFYSIPRAGKRIEGPSIRMAEILMYAYGNLRGEAFVTKIGATHLTAVGVCFDLERNVAVRHSVERRITDSNNRRYNDDMIGVTSNAACSIALREAVFKIVPRSLWKDVQAKARDVSLGKGLTMQQRRTKAFGWFDQAGISEDRVLEVLDRRGVEEITVEDLITLTGMKTAIKDGDASIDDLFPEQKASTKATASLNEQLEKQAASAPSFDDLAIPEPVLPSEERAAAEASAQQEKTEPTPEPETARSTPEPCPFCGEGPLRCTCNIDEGEMAESRRRGRKSEPAQAQAGPNAGLNFEF